MRDELGAVELGLAPVLPLDERLRELDRLPVKIGVVAPIDLRRPGAVELLGDGRLDLP